MSQSEIIRAFHLKGHPILPGGLGELSTLPMTSHTGGPHFLNPVAESASREHGPGCMQWPQQYVSFMKWPDLNYSLPL